MDRYDIAALLALVALAVGPWAFAGTLATAWGIYLAWNGSLDPRHGIPGHPGRMA